MEPEHLASWAIWCKSPLQACSLTIRLRNDVAIFVVPEIGVNLVTSIENTTA
jgi:hypothetical protein